MGISIHNIEITLLALVVVVALLAVFARRLKVPYPIILVLGGLALVLSTLLGFVPAGRRATRIDQPAA